MTAPGGLAPSPLLRWGVSVCRPLRQSIREAIVTLHSIALGLSATALLVTAAAAQAPQLVTEEMMVKSSDAGIALYVRNKRPAGMTSFRPERTVLYVHGATYPASTAFDLKLDNLSWMDY